VLRPGHRTGEPAVTGETAGEPTVTGKIPAKFHDEISEFARHYNKRLYGHLLQLTQGDHALADDLVQQVLIEVALDWEKIRVLDDSGQRKRLHVMARRRAVDAFRKNTTARNYESRMPPADPPAETDPFVYAVAAETVARFDSAIENMPVRQAQAARLYLFYRLRNAEIADELGISPGAVTHLLSRARTRIRNDVGPYLSDEPHDPEGGA